MAGVRVGTPPAICVDLGDERSEEEVTESVVLLAEPADRRPGLES